jgi:hypothetical protein
VQDEAAPKPMWAAKLPGEVADGKALGGAEALDGQQHCEGRPH